MAWDNYEAFRMNVSDWLARSDLNAQIPDFIRLAEKRIQREIKSLRTTDVQKRGTLVSGQDFVLLPDDLIELHFLRIDTNPIRNVDIVSLDELARVRQNDDGGKPRVAVVRGQFLDLAPTPTAADNYVLFYRQGLRSVVPINEILDPSFETLDITDYWNATSSGGTWSIVEDSSASPDGKAMLQYDSTSQTAQAMIEANSDFPNDRHYRAMRTFHAEKFDLSIQGRRTTAVDPITGYVRLGIRWYDADGQLVTTDQSALWEPGTAWATFSWRSTPAPQDARFVVPTVLIDSGGPSGVIYQFDEFQTLRVGTTATNWILQQAPDVLLYASLLEAMPYIGADERIQTWSRMYERAAQSLNRQEWRARMSGGPLRSLPRTVV